MSKDEISELLRTWMPLNRVAEKFGIPRGSFYRQMDYYKEGKDRKMNPVVKDFFDRLVMGKISTQEQFEKELEDIEFMMESQKEAYKNELDRLHSEYMDARYHYRLDQSSMTMNQKVKAQEEIKRMEAEMKELAEKAGEEYEASWDQPIQRRLTWNKGSIRSASFCGAGHVKIVIEADYGSCRDIQVELLLEISGEDYPVGIFNVIPDTKIVDLDEIVEGPRYRYRLKWMEEGKEKFTESYPLVFEEY